jgi:hypothetical protein
MTIPTQYSRLEAGIDFWPVADEPSSRGAQWRFQRCSINDNGRLPIVPTVVDWPYASDINGQAYPAGLVGVITSWDIRATVEENYDTGCIVAVPAELPSGYTPRLYRDHQHQLNQSLSIPMSIGRWTPLNAAPFSSYFGFAGPAADLGLRVRSTEGLHDYDWLPDNHHNLALTCNDAFTGEAPWLFGYLTGLRYFRLRIVDAGVDEKLQVRMQSDGTQPATALTPADTLIWEHELLSGAGSYDSGYVYINHEAPFGQRCYYQLFNYTKVAGVYVPGPRSVLDFEAGPRLDIPLPFLASSVSGDVVVPGGIVPGVIPGY